MLRVALVFCTAAILFVASVKTSEAPQNDEGCGKPPQNDEGCKKLPTGTWVMDHFTPLLPDDPTLKQHAKTVLQFRELRENVYVADGAGLFYLAYVLDIYKGNVFDYHIGGIFNPKTCMFSGIVFNVKYEPLFPDAVEYFYDGEQLKGPCIFSIGSPGKPDRVVFPQAAYHNATFTFLE